MTEPRKILVVNSNSNPAVTLRLQRGLEQHIRPATQITFLNAVAGPEGIDTHLDVAVSSVETAKVVAANRGAYQAYIVACGADPGVDVCRQIVDEPVVGIAESAMLMACTLGYKFSILTTLQAEIPSVEELVAKYGLSRRLASVRAIEMSTARLADRDEALRRLVDGARRAVNDDRAEVIVLTGSVMLDLDAAISASVSVPVLAGLVCAYHMAEALVDYGQKTSRAYKYRQLVKQDRLIGYEELQPVYSMDRSELRP